ncbi:MAG: teicoplanin resistance protein VanZ, partial [Betaproteobacteria bacterium]
MALWQPSTLARYLFAAYVPLVIYASLDPFSGWRDRGLPPFAFLAAPFPRPIPVFDVVANIIGYTPLGFLAVLAVYPWLRHGYALGFGLACSVLLSFALESLQLYLPTRTSSNLDLLANTGGGA